MKNTQTIACLLNLPMNSFTNQLQFLKQQTIQYPMFSMRPQHFQLLAKQSIRSALKLLLIVPKYTVTLLPVVLHQQFLLSFSWGREERDRDCKNEVLPTRKYKQKKKHVISIPNVISGKVFEFFFCFSSFSIPNTLSHPHILYRMSRITIKPQVSLGSPWQPLSSETE